MTTTTRWRPAWPRPRDRLPRPPSSWAAVFGAFLVADVLELKEFGFALAGAVLLDATLVRLPPVPAFMKVAGGGKANWWLPKWLGRILPRVRLE